MMAIGQFRAELGPLSRQEAAHWARRLRRIGFRPVEVHYHEFNERYQLRANWPFAVTDLPVDLVDWLEQHLAMGGEVYGCLSEVIHVGNRAEAREILRIYGVARLGMGSRPIRRVRSHKEGIVLVPTQRLHNLD